MGEQKNIQVPAPEAIEARPATSFPVLGVVALLKGAGILLPTKFSFLRAFICIPPSPNSVFLFLDSHFIWFECS